MAYTLATSYVGESLLSGFNWFNGTDPSNGYVAYQSRADAEAQSIVSLDTDTNVVRLGVDSTNVFGEDEGRPSIRLESKEAFNHGLYIADFEHMPPSQCGLWPAFWTYGENWPAGGELDIIEGVNTAHNNIISAHTGPGCVLDPAGPSTTPAFSGEQRNDDCFVGDQNIGCGFNPPDSDLHTYGDSFNAVGGGVYAMQWDDEVIRVWHFARDEVPADIDAGNPDPSSWVLPQAVFGGSRCDVDGHFTDMSIVININFCGDYGDATWDATCSDHAPTCSSYVANNPQAFANAYWDVKYIKAY
ncbi:family 16 glycoside hydrolase, partial [Emericellopsis atlantica]